MLDILHQLFGAVCGQDPDHTWAPGGLLLPCCQRCLGLYAGAGIAALLHLRFRPQLTGRFLEAHGGFLLLMAPFGFHWVPQGPVLRTISGLLFGFGTFAFLWLPLSGRFADPGAFGTGLGRIGLIGLIGRRRFAKGETFGMRPRLMAYNIGLAVAAVLVPLLAAFGGRGIAYALSGLAFFGLAALAAVICGNFALALHGAVQLLRRRSQPRHQE
jgi:uncharacterized membrane protein